MALTITNIIEPGLTDSSFFATGTTDATLPVAQSLFLGFKPTELEVYNTTSNLRDTFTAGMTAADFIREATEAGYNVNDMVTYSITLSPAQVAADTTAEELFTVTGIAATSLVYVSKPTAQAGLGICGYRASAANQIGITFSNATAGALTPTATQLYTVIEIKTGLHTALTISPASVAANSSAEQTFTMAGLRTGMVVWVNKPTAQAGLGIGGCRVVSTGVLGITFLNSTAAAIVPTASEAYRVFGTTGLNAVDNTLIYGVNVGTLAAVNTVTAPELIVATLGMLTTDTIMGVSKPTAQAGLGTGYGRVSSAGNIAFQFVNPTAGNITPTADEVYQVSVYRSVPVAPLKLYTQTLTPVSVATITTAEQTFTVTGLIVSSFVTVSAPALQAGLSIVGARVSAADTLALVFQNDTAGALVPNAGSFVIGNFQQIAIGTTTSYVKQAIVPNQINQLAAVSGGGFTLLDGSETAPAAKAVGSPGSEGPGVTLGTALLPPSSSFLFIARR